MIRLFTLLTLAALLLVPGGAFAQTTGVVPVQVTTSKDTNIGGDTDKGIGGDTDKNIGGDTDTNIGGDLGDKNKSGLTNPLKSIDSLPQLLEVVLGAIVQIGTIILTLALVYVGFLFVVAQGNEEKISNAKSALLWTIIGGLVLLGASAIGAVIGSTVDKL